MNVTEICLDANVLISRLTPESHSKECRRILDFIEENNIVLYAPALIVFEVTSTFYRKVLQKEWSLEEAYKGLDFFSQLPLLLQWQSYLMKKASLFAHQMNFKNTYDCSYLSVAEARQMPLVTLDQDFYKKAKKVYKHVYLVNEFIKKMI